jgi:Lipocalin-like domain
MLLRGIAARMAATVSRALPSAVVHDNAIPGNSGQSIRPQGIKSRTSSVIGVIFLTATLAAFSRAGNAWGAEQTAHEQDRTLSIGEQIVGTWWLDSIYEENSRGEDIDQFGVAPTGLFMADRNGNFSFQIMSIDGRRYAAKGLSPAGMGAAGIAEAMTYFGTYAVNERNHKLTLHLEYCLFRSRDNTDLTAEIKITGDTMEFISTVDTSPTGASYSRTVWKRRCCI